jgi:hypothetical protein
MENMTEEQLQGWSHCMVDKIVGHYGEIARDCAEGISHGNFKEILECIAKLMPSVNPEVWIPEQLAYFTGWSIECAF